MPLLADTFDTPDEYLAAYFMALGFIVQGLCRVAGDWRLHYLFLVTPRLTTALRDYETNGPIPVQTYRQMLERLQLKIRRFREEEAA